MSYQPASADVRAMNISWGPSKDESLILKPISFHLTAGRVLGIVGPNGAGKSTLLRLLYRFNLPATGNVEVDGQDIWNLSPRATARMIAAVLQEQPSDFALTVRDVVSLGRLPHRLGLSVHGEDDGVIVDQVLARMHLTALQDRDFGTLSGGERQRCMVARALAQQPRVLVLDEPTNHLDIRHQLEILRLISDLDLTIIVTLHDLNMAMQVCDDVLVLKDGNSMGFGPPARVLTEQLVSETFEVTTRLEQLSLSQTDHFSYQLNH
ncbi:ABC transporter ATP-binding protein [Cognatishimia activa]|uniref:ABC transporter ATP-binding protein n=1 Tax=Cognatishimia activa TaxID=1715691 RepID=UPI002231A5BA|nr:ABC transporter ATP-binding protein [Cognatishimia activa]UZD90989.1 ABC transporter ATP-binding protein [Cognatishimia activa]